ncbi:MAG: oxidoreductase [Gammaproteobacteria bacterium]|nr:MAG: oxidoreductase [Gammaproteobacteria bacterium]
MNNYLHKIIKLKFLTESTILLRVKRNDIIFKAGQCFSLAPTGLGINREYSIYSGENDDYLEFIIKIVENGTVTPKFKPLKAGDNIEIAGPYGEFCLDINKLNHTYLFIATGTGIAPFHSFVKTYPDINYQIIHGIRYNNEKYDSTDYKTGKYIACVSREETIDFKGRITDYLKTMEIAKNTISYLCGNRAMLIDAYDILREKEISGNNIITEVFF